MAPPAANHRNKSASERTGLSSASATFPATSLGSQLKQVAQLIKLNLSTLGLSRQLFFCSLGGFDTHNNQAAAHASLLTQLSDALAAFYAATEELNVADAVTAFTLSDFARTFQANGNAGTDHGWGSHALIMGGAVNGGALYGTYPTLGLSGPDDSGSRGTWVPSTSQDQYLGALAKWFGLAQADMDYVFPNLKTFGYQTPAFI